MTPAERIDQLLARCGELEQDYLEALVLIERAANMLRLGSHKQREALAEELDDLTRTEEDVDAFLDAREEQRFKAQVADLIRRGEAEAFIGTDGKVNYRTKPAKGAP